MKEINYKPVLVDTEKDSCIFKSYEAGGIHFCSAGKVNRFDKNQILCVVSNKKPEINEYFILEGELHYRYPKTADIIWQAGEVVVSSSSAALTSKSIISEKMQKEVVDNIVDSVLPEIKNFKNNFIKSANCATHSDGQDVCKCYNEIDFDVIPQGKMIHELKTIQPYFDECFTGHKTFEIRRNDRCFQKGDTLILKEWDNEKQKYTGRSLKRTVAFILCDAPQFGLMDGFVIMSIK